MDPLSRLLRDGSRGDAAALGRFIGSVHDEVWRCCAALVDVATADDLAQEVMVRVLRAAPGYRGDASARTWVLAIARNVCMDELRRRVRRRGTAEGPVREPSTPDRAADVEVADLLDRLDPERRQAFALTQLLGLTYREAAEVCGCPMGTIRSRVARARADLIDLLGRDLSAGGEGRLARPG